ncbi:hypothetical protein Mapa_007167 [Marchantia paleacea]|nr:hypothetical protein Mapa_007167 [Marchantia paleacea]
MPRRRPLLLLLLADRQTTSSLQLCRTDGALQHMDYPSLNEAVPLKNISGPEASVAASPWTACCLPTARIRCPFPKSFSTSRRLQRTNRLQLIRSITAFCSIYSTNCKVALSPFPVELSLLTPSMGSAVSPVCTQRKKGREHSAVKANAGFHHLNIQSGWSNRERMCPTDVLKSSHQLQCKRIVDTISRQ